jgi:uncharacterized protein YndB with AHSA1/START domain
MPACAFLGGVPLSTQGETVMDKIVVSTLIRKPVKQVFDFISTPENGGRWQAGASETRRTSQGPMGLGSTFQSASQDRDGPIENNFEVTAFKPERKFAFKSVSTQMSTSYIFDAVEAGTRLTATTQPPDPVGFLKIASPFLARQFKRRFVGDIARMKNLLEAGE